MNIENCPVRPNFGETHLAKNFPNVLKIGNIDGADKYTKIDIMDICFFFLVDSCLLKKIHVDGSNICANNKG